MNDEQFKALIIIAGIITSIIYLLSGIGLFFQLTLFFTIWSVLNKIL